MKYYYNPDRIEKLETLMKQISEMFLSLYSINQRKFFQSEGYFVKLETNILFDAILIVKRTHTDIEPLFKIHYSSPNVLLYDTGDYKQMHLFSLRIKKYLEGILGKVLPKSKSFTYEENKVESIETKLKSLWT